MIRWLESWQQRPEAWGVADRILHDPSSSLEAQFYAAQTLKIKVSRDFEELPAEAALSLRDSLVTLLLRFCKVILLFMGWWRGLASQCGSPPIMFFFVFLLSHFCPEPL
jgi:hypothetical protein